MSGLFYNDFKLFRIIINSIFLRAEWLLGYWRQSKIKLYKYPVCQGGWNVYDNSMSG